MKISLANCLALCVASAALVGTSARAAIINNPGFEATSLGSKAANSGAITGYRTFAGGGNSGGYTFEVVSDASEGARAVQISRSLSTGAGGGIDTFNQEDLRTGGETINVLFDAKDFVEAGTDIDSNVQLEVAFRAAGATGSTGNLVGNVTQIFSLTDDYQTFGISDLTVPTATPYVYVGVRNLNAANIAGISSIVVDNLRITNPVVPEPATLTLAAAGAAMLLGRRRKS